MAKAFLQRITAAIDFDPIIISGLQHLIQNRPILLSISGQGETLCLIIRYSSVWTIESDTLLNVMRCNTMGLPAACAGADFEKAETSSTCPGLYMSRMSDYFANKSSITITFRMYPE